MRWTRLLLACALPAVALGACSDDEAAAPPDEETDFCQDLLALQGVGPMTNAEWFEQLKGLDETVPADFEDDLEILIGVFAELNSIAPDKEATGPGLAMAQAGEAQDQAAFMTALQNLTVYGEESCGFDPDTPPTSAPGAESVPESSPPTTADEAG